MPVSIAPLLLSPAFLSTAAADDAGLLAPVQLHAGGKAIDISDTGTAYAGPLVHDVDGDGVHDLIVTSIRGNFRHYRNVGSWIRSKPKDA